MYGVDVAQKPIKYFPTEIKENAQAHIAIRNFLKKRKGTLMQRGLRLLKQWRIKGAAKRA
jgi:hypothetical protein